MTKVRDIMTTQLVTLFEQQTLPLASDLMKFKKIRHLPVVDDDGFLVGLVTHRDILAAKFSVLSGIPDDLPHDRLQDWVKVSEILNKDVWTVSPDTDAADAAQLLLDHKFSCLPVVEEGRKLVGIITEADFLSFALEILGKSR